MIIKKGQLKQIIHKAISEAFDLKGYDWYDFQKMARAGNDIGCGRWLENIMDKLNGTSPYTRHRLNPKYILELEEVYELIDYAKNKNVTTDQLEAKFNVLIGAR